jgi:predicted lipoprotein
MKNVLLAILLLLPLIANAQDMMQKAMEMQQCVQGIDQAELRDLEQRSQTLQQELKSLCDSGKDEQALKHAMEFGKVIMNSNSMKKMRECSKIMEGFIPEIPFADYDKDFENVNVCEGL